MGSLRFAGTTIAGEYFICLRLSRPARIGIGGSRRIGKNRVDGFGSARHAGSATTLPRSPTTSTPNGMRISGALGVADRRIASPASRRRLPAYCDTRDASMNLAAVADMLAKFPDLDMVLIESAATISRHFLARARRPHDLRDRRRGRRQDSLEGRPRHHPIAFSSLTDRPRAACRCFAGENGHRYQAGCAANGRLS